MEIIPAIDLLNGNCVRLNKGDYSQVTKFSDDPVSQALFWQEEGARRLHLVDLDGAKTGEPINDENVKAITKALDIPIQIGGGIRSSKRAEDLLAYGVSKVILGTVAIEEPNLVKELAKKYPGRIIVGIDAKNGKVATRGWLKKSNIDAIELVKSLNEIDIDGIIATDIDTDGTLKGPNLEAMRQISTNSKVPLIASGGVGSMADLMSLLPLEELGVKGVIVGRALYDGAINLKEAINAIGENRMQDVTNLNSFIS